MRNAILLAAALAAAVGCTPPPPVAPPPAAAPAAASAAAAQAHLAGLEAEIAKAITTRDTATFHRLMAEEFALVPADPAAPSMPRAAWMNVMLERLSIDSARVSEVRVVEMAGDTAQVELLFYWKGRAGGQAVVDQSLRLRDVWVRRDGSWRMVRRRTLQ